MRPAAHFVLLGLAICCAGCQPKARITVRVVDDGGQPVTAAKVVVLGFNREQEGKTDRQGRFTATVRTALAGVDIVVDKKGFYSIHRHIHEFTGGLLDRRWQPWNPEVELPLRKMGKSVPMVEKNVEAELPTLEQPVGYDLLKSDWVTPYGSGVVPDFVFEAKRWSNGSNDVNGWLKLTFSNPEDGLVPVRIHWRNEYGLKLPAIAPQNSYQGKWWWGVGQGEAPPAEGWKKELNTDQDENYYFRVRTRVGAYSGPIRTAIPIHFGH